MLAFSAGALVATALMDLIPEALEILTGPGVPFTNPSARIQFATRR